MNKVRYFVVLVVAGFLAVVLPTVGVTATSGAGYTLHFPLNEHHLDPASNTLADEIARAIASHTGQYGWDCPRDYELGQLRKADGWFFANAACWPDTQTDPEVWVPSVIRFVIGQYNGNEWVIYFEGTPEFYQAILDAPESLLNTQSKDHFVRVRQALLEKATPSASEVYSIGLPWQYGATWYYRTSIHGSNNGLDFASPCGTVGEVHAADAGTVIWAHETCMLVQNSSGLGVGYQHINSNDIAQWQNGEIVHNGDVLGNTTRDSGCNGNTDAHHVHFWLNNQNPNGSTFGGWTLNDPWLNKGSESKYPNLACVSSAAIYYDAPDTTAPTIAITQQPATGAWYNTDQTIAFTISDAGSGVRGYKFAWDQNPPQSAEQSGASGSTNLSAANQGQHTLYVQAWDNAGNPSAVAAAGWFGYDTFAPLNPSSVSPGCVASNNFWQNTCADPNFTWSGASDGVGSGVKDYHYYWGSDPNGVPSTYTSAAGFDPPSVAGPVAARYLRIATRDNLNQESLPSTVFVFLYDASAPTATVQINHGAASANQVDVTLNLTASDLGSGVAGVRLSNNGQTWTDASYTSEIPWTLPAINHSAHTVYVRARDRVGNLSAIVSDTIDLDLYPVAPHSPSYRICQDVMNVGGSTRITSTNYLLASAIGQPTASGANSNISGSFNGQSGFLANLTGCLPITYTATSNYTLTQWVIASAGNVRGSASYRLGDTAGQALASGAAMFSSTTYRMSSGFWAAITTTIPITTTPPTPIPTHTPTPTPTPSPTATPQPTSFGVTINDGGLYTNNSQVTVRAWAPNVIQTMLSNDGGFLNASWQTYQLTYTWVMSTYGNTSMPRLVYVRFRDGANTEYGTYFDDIIYDPVAPQGSVSILGGETQTVTLWLEGHDDYSGVADVRLSENPQALEGAVWQAYTNLVEWPLVGNVVYAQFRDKAGNRSPIYASDGTTYTPNAKKVYLPLILK